MKDFFERKPVIILLMVTILGVVGTSLAAELFLALFYPCNIGNVGHRYSKNALLYGWGFNPGETITIIDPDTGTRYIDRANNRGWRDTNRNFTNDTEAFRILALGDSNTYGTIVPADKIYTRVLENKLNEQGYRVEVINIAYGQWGTDQQLEALKNEGLQYNPDVVIMQFCINDLEENTYFQQAIEENNEKLKQWKPFYYSIADDNRLLRHTNPYFFDDKRKTWRTRIKHIISKSELLKRTYLLYRRSKKSHDKTGSYIESSLEQTAYSISENQLLQLKLGLQLDTNTAFMRFLREKIDKQVDEEELIRAIDSAGLSSQKHIILQVLEKQPFHEYWSPADFHPAQQDPRSFTWRLYFKMILEANRLVKEKGARLVLFSDNELGYYQWEVPWLRVSDDEVSRQNYLHPTRLIKQFALQHDIGFIDSTVPHKRARNDPHPNIEGNKAMSENIYSYLISTCRDALEGHRKRGTGGA